MPVDLLVSLLPIFFLKALPEWGGRGLEISVFCSLPSKAIMVLKLKNPEQ